MCAEVLTEVEVETLEPAWDGAHATQIVSSYIFWVECSGGWKSPARGSHTKALEESLAHRAEGER